MSGPAALCNQNLQPPSSNLFTPISKGRGDGHTKLTTHVMSSAFPPVYSCPRARRHSGNPRPRRVTSLLHGLRYFVSTLCFAAMSTRSDAAWHRASLSGSGFQTNKYSRGQVPVQYTGRHLSSEACVAQDSVPQTYLLRERIVAHTPRRVSSDDADDILVVHVVE